MKFLTPFFIFFCVFVSQSFFAQENKKIDVNKDISITKVEVSDLLGRRLLSVNGNVNSLDVSLLQSGVLFVKVYTTQGAIVKKVVKM